LNKNTECGGPLSVARGMGALGSAIRLFVEDSSEAASH
jgi:hypothetical protein